MNYSINLKFLYSNYDKNKNTISNVDLSSSDEAQSLCFSSTSVTGDADESSDSDDPPTAKRSASATSECVEVANFVQSRSLSADSQYNLLKNHFKPGVN